jgi:sugar phosphate permease
MDDNLVRRMLSFRWLVFGILAIAYFFVYFHRLSLSVVANDIATDFGTTASVLGLLGSVYFYCYAAMQFPAGLFSDSIGPRKTVTISLLLACIGSFLFGLSPNISVAFVARVMVGLGVSMVFIPTMKILSQWFRTNEFAMMAGVLNATGGIGVLAATWLLGILATNVGWRISFQFIGGCTLLLLILAWFIVRDRPADKGWPSIKEVDVKSDKNDLSVPQIIGLWEGARKVVSEKYFWPVAIWFFFDCGIFFGFGGLWGGPYLMHVYGMTREQAGNILSMLAWGMIIGSPLLGLLSEKVLKSRKKTFMLCTSVLTVLLMFINFFAANLPSFILALWFFLFSVCSSAIVIMAFTTTKELFPVEIAGTSVGTVNLFPFLGGAVFMPLLGRILDSYPKTSASEFSVQGYRMVLLVLLVASTISLICTFFMKETYRR